MQQSLRRPVNWQDFEELCKKLWGEIWNCPEIVRHGRNGQDQYGVDIYGIPAGKTGYYGIQCKGKDEYTHQQFTEKEIDEEIEKAKRFTPPLENYYLATTAVKDAKIEAYIRKKNVELRKAGLFSVALFSWEDIVDLIDENKRTYDYYVRGQKYTALKAAEITFKDGATEITLHPQFEKKITIYRRKGIHPTLLSPLYGLSGMVAAFNAANKLETIGTVFNFGSPRTTCNLSYAKFNLLIYNSGIDSLEDYKVKFRLEGNIEDITSSNVTDSGSGFSIPKIMSINNKDVHLEKTTLSGVFAPLRRHLVGKDSYLSDDIFIKTPPEKTDIVIYWELLAKEYNSQGTLTIHVDPVIDERISVVEADDNSQVLKPNEEEIKDKIIEEICDKE